MATEAKPLDCLGRRALTGTLLLQTRMNYSARNDAAGASRQRGRHAQRAPVQRGCWSRIARAECQGLTCLPHQQLTVVATPQALADREADVRSGRLSTIVYVRDRNAGGQEVSGYIDYGHRRGTLLRGLRLLASGGNGRRCRGLA